MHKIIDYICDELEELEHRIEKEGKLSMQETEYGDLLAHFEKCLLTADAMLEYDDDHYHDGYSYARGRRGNVKRDSMGRYSRDMRPYMYDRHYSRNKSDLVHELRELEMTMTDDATKDMLKRFIKMAEENE